MVKPADDVHEYKGLFKHAPASMPHQLPECNKYFYLFYLSTVPLHLCVWPPSWHTSRLLRIPQDFAACGAVLTILLLASIPIAGCLCLAPLYIILTLQSRAQSLPRYRAIDDDLHSG